LTALCQQIVSTFFLAALHFLERRIVMCAENIRDMSNGRTASIIIRVI